MKILAVVVTYNRLNLVKKTIESLNNQKHKLDGIIVVDNGCYDGTSSWLDNQQNLIVIHQSNVGGSGGFFSGIKKAYELGANWIWCMDDDVFPTEDCLNRLLNVSSDTKIGIRCPKRIQEKNTVYGEFLKLNLTNPFKPLHIARMNNSLSQKNCFIEAMAFEGPLISRDVVQSIGLPNKNLFILYDDTDYSYRAILAGFKILYVHDAILDKYNFTSNQTARELCKKNRWKSLYDCRNYTYFMHHYGKNVFIRYINSSFKMISYQMHIIYNLLFKKGDIYEIKDVFKFLKSYWQGLHEKLSQLDF